MLQNNIDYLLGRTVNKVRAMAALRELTAELQETDLRIEPKVLIGVEIDGVMCRQTSEGWVPLTPEDYLPDESHLEGLPRQVRQVVARYTKPQGRTAPDPQLVTLARQLARVALGTVEDTPPMVQIMVRLAPNPNKV